MRCNPYCQISLFTKPLSISISVSCKLGRLPSVLVCSLESQIRFVKLVEHLFGMVLECLGEQVVEVDLVFLVNARYGDSAAITGLACASSGAGFFFRALFGNDFSCGGSHLTLRLVFPVFEAGVSHDEVGDPRVGPSDEILVHTVLEVLLLVSIEEEVETGQVTK